MFAYEKVKLSLWLIKHHDMKTHAEVEGKHHVFLTYGLDEGDWTALHLGHFNPGERAAGTHWLEAGWGPEPVWTLRRIKRSLASIWNRTLIPGLSSPDLRRYPDPYSFIHTQICS
jgi:hypothetical protein